MNCVFCSDFSVLLGPGLLSTTGTQHKRQRKLLNPVFSVAHLRDMVQIFYNVAHQARLSPISYSAAQFKSGFIGTEGDRHTRSRRRDG